MNLNVYKIQSCAVQDLFQRTISIVFSFIKVLIYINKTPSGRLRELKNKGKVQLGSSKSGRDRLRKLFIKKFKSWFKRGFTKVVVTRAGRLREGSQGELRL